MEQKVSKELQEKTLIALFDAIKNADEVLITQLEKAFVKNKCWKMNNSLEPVLRRLIARVSNVVPVVVDDSTNDLSAKSVENKLVEYLLLEKAPYALGFDTVFNSVISGCCVESLKCEFNLSNLLRIRDLAQEKELEHQIELSVKDLEKKGNKGSMKLSELNLEEVKGKVNRDVFLESAVHSWTMLNAKDKSWKKLIKVKSKKFQPLMFSLKSKMQLPELFYHDMVDFLEKRAISAGSAHLGGARAYGAGKIGAPLSFLEKRGSNKELIYWQEYLCYIQCLYKSTVDSYKHRVSMDNLRRVGVPALGLKGANRDEFGHVKGAVRVDPLSEKETSILNLCLKSYDGFLAKISDVDKTYQVKLKRLYNLSLQEGLFYSVSVVPIESHFKKFLDLGASYKHFWHNDGPSARVGWSARGPNHDNLVTGVKNALSDLSYFGAKTVLNILDKNVRAKSVVGSCSNSESASTQEGIELSRNLKYVLLGLKNNSMNDADGASALGEILCPRTVSGQKNIEMKHSLSIMKRTLLEFEDFIGDRPLDKGMVQTLLNACTYWAIGFTEQRLMLDKKAYQKYEGSKVDYGFLKQPPVQCLEFDSASWLKEVSRFLIERCSEDLSLNDLLISRLDSLEGNSSHYERDRKWEELKKDFADEMFGMLWIEGEVASRSQHGDGAEEKVLLAEEKVLLIERLCELDFGYKDWIKTGVGVRTKKENLEASLRTKSSSNIFNVHPEDGLLLRDSVSDLEFKKRLAIKAQMLRQIEKTKNNLTEASKHWFWRYGTPGVLSYYGLLNSLIDAGVKSGLVLTYKEKSNKENLCTDTVNVSSSQDGGIALSEKMEIDGELKVSVGKMLSPKSFVGGSVLKDLTSQAVDQNALNISSIETLVFKEELCSVKPGAKIEKTNRITSCSESGSNSIENNNGEESSDLQIVEESKVVKKLKML